MNILFIDTVHPLLWEMLLKDGHQCTDGSGWTESMIHVRIPDFDGVVIRSRIQIGKDLLDGANQLKFIARAGAGMESIDVNYATKKGIVCLNSPEGNRDAVGEHALGMLLMLFNNLNRADHQVRAGNWIREKNRGIELQGKTVGLIGYGNMGSAFASKLSGMDCRVIVYDKYRKNFSDKHVHEEGMEELFRETDVLSLHVPLTEETTFLVNDEFISKFFRDIFIINTARGKCIRTADLVKNMKSGKVQGACLDVIEYEDTSFEKFSPGNTSVQENPDWQYLIHSEKVVLSPHIAGWTFESHEKISRVLYEKIAALNKKL